MKNAASAKLSLKRDPLLGGATQTWLDARQRVNGQAERILEIDLVSKTDTRLAETFTGVTPS